MTELKKRGVIDQLAPMVISLVAIGITLAVGFLVLAEIASNDAVMDNKNASVAVNETVDAMADIPGWLPIIVIVIIGALLLSLIAMFRRT